jgi:hypothetical protein
MRYDESEVIYGWSCMDKVLPEILVICAFWVGTLFLPADIRPIGIEIAWLATSMAAGWACWKAGFMSIALLMMGILAMAFGKGYGYVFFALAGLAALGTAISVHIRRRRDRSRTRSDAELQARGRLRRMREEELSVGAAFRRGHAVTRPPGVLSARTSAPPLSPSGPRAAASTPSSSGSYTSPGNDSYVATSFLSGGFESASVDTSSCDSGSDSGGGASCGGD